MDEQYFQKAIKDYDLSEKAQNALIINGIDSCSSFLSVDIRKLYYTEKGYNQTTYELSCFKDMLRDKLLDEPNIVKQIEKKGTRNKKIASDVIEEFINERELPQKKHNIIQTLAREFTEEEITESLSNSAKFINPGNKFYDRKQNWEERSCLRLIESLPKPLSEFAQYFVNSNKKSSYPSVMAFVFIKNMDNDASINIDKLYDLFYDFHLHRYKNNLLIEENGEIVNQIGEISKNKIKWIACQTLFRYLSASDAFEIISHNRIRLKISYAKALCDNNKKDLLLLIIYDAINEYYQKITKEPKIVSSERKPESPIHEVTSDFSKPNLLVDPEDVIAWMVTQMNANGKLYLEHVVRQYMSALQVTPGKLQIPDVVNVKSVFTCQTPDELNAYWDIFRSAPNYKQVNRSISGMFSAGMSCYMRYLQHLTDELNAKKPDIFQLIERYNLEHVDKRDSGGALWVIGGRELSPTMMKLQESGFPFVFKKFGGRGRSSNHRDAWWYKSSETIIGQKSDDLEEAHPINKEPKNITNSAKRVGFTRPGLFAHTHPLACTMPKTMLDSAVVGQLTNVLSSHFANGYRLNSPIEMARFRSFAAEDLDEEIMLTDEELKSYISACGITYDGKVYAVSEETKDRIKELVDEYFSEGARSIFFVEFYAKNEKWLFEASVVSEGMLIEILRGLFPKLSFTKTYFGYTDASVFVAIEGEILRVWGENLLRTYGQLAECLRYIPLERIKSVLGQNGDFIWSSVETFSHVSRIEITDEDRQTISEVAVQECNAHGYVSIADLPFGKIEELNYELSTTAVHDAVYRICLSGKFDKKGKIIAFKGNVFDALTIMKKYCQALDKCSLDELLTYEKELTGEVHRWIPMKASNSVLVRIDKNAYVADRYVRFNIEIIDEAIGLFVKGDYLPLKSFTTFGAFPDCGQMWNLFLLESYCRRFSRKFRFDTSSVNSRNAGAVIRKSCDMGYTDIMADAVANADVPLKDTAVGKFLYESGYTSRRTTAKVNEIIDKATAKRRD